MDSRLRKNRLLSPLSLVMIAVLLLGVGALAIALMVRDNPKTTDPEVTTAGSGLGPTELRAEAKTLFENGEFENAIPAFEEYLDNEPEDAQILSDYAQALWLTGDRDGALAQFLAADMVSPKDASLSYRIGILLRQMERTDEAIERLEKAVEIDDTTSVYFAELAKTYRTTNDYPSSVGAWESAIELSPEEGRLAAALYAELGNTYRLSGDDIAARTAFQDGLESDPDNQLLKQLLAELE